MTPFKNTNSYFYYDEKRKQEKIMLGSTVKILICSIILIFSDTTDERLHVLWGVAVGFFLNDFIRAFRHHRELVKLWS